MAEGLTWTNAASYNDSKIDNDYNNGTTVVASAGKTVVDAPKVLFNSSMAPSYTTFDLSAGYTIKPRGLRSITLQVNALNLFDEEFISTIGTGGFSVRGDLETLMAGQKRLVFVSLNTAF